MHTMRCLTHWIDSEEISIHPSCWTMTKRHFFLLMILGFCTMWQNADAQTTLGKPDLRIPPIGIETDIVEFYCKLDEIPIEETILYKLFKEDNLNKTMAEYSAHSKEEGTFIVIVKLAYDGWFVCTASVQNHTEILPTFSDRRRFKVLVPVEGANIISSQSLEDLWEGENLTLQCNIIKGNYLFYDWILNNMTLQRNTSKILHIPSLSRENSGEYFCLAKNYLNDTTYYANESAGRIVHVKEYLSKPEISLNSVKDAKGSFSAYMNCKVKNGSLPINFTLFRNNHSVATVISQHPNVKFEVPIVLDQDMGKVYCQANNGKKTEQSEELNLKVVLLEGPVTMRLKKIEGQDFDTLGVFIYCQAEKGTFLQYQWFFNNQRLEKKGTFHQIFYEDNSGLIFSLDPHGATDGDYHCEVISTFDNTKRLRSLEKIPISHEELNKIPTIVAVTIFTLFSLLICVVLACCIYGVVLRKMEARKYIFRLKDFPDMHSVIDDDNDEEDDHDEKTEEIEEDKYEELEHEDLDTEAYIEDVEVIQDLIEYLDESEEEEETDVDNNNF